MLPMQKALNYKPCFNSKIIKHNMISSRVHVFRKLIISSFASQHRIFAVVKSLNDNIFYNFRQTD
jgi:hypothetical protein